MAIKQFNSIAGFSIGGDPTPITVVDSNANVTANTLVVNANASITGNITVGNANLGNLATANFFQGDGGLLTNIAVSAGTSIVNGTSNVAVGLNGNITVGVGGSPNVFVVSNAGANVSGALDATGNISATYFIGNGSLLTGITGGGGTSITTQITTATSVSTAINNRYIIASTTGATLTLPGTPSLGDTVYFAVANDLANNVIARNGQNIMGVAEDMTINVNDISFSLVFANSTLGWRIS